MKTRDWLFTIALLLLVEYTIFNWTYSFGSDKVLVDHLSFAGTVVSTILAVVAIFYSFIQSESQTRSSSQIAAQIDSLKEVVKEVDSSKTKFSGELDRVGEIVARLDLLDGHVGESRKAISTVNDQLGELSNALVATIKREEKRPLPHSERVSEIATTDTQKQNALNIVFATLDTYLLAYALKLSAGQEVPEDDLMMEHFAHPLADLAQKEANGDVEKWKDIFRRRATLAYGNMRILRAFGLLSLVGEKDVVVLAPQLVDVLNNVSFFFEDEDSSAVAKSARAIKDSFNKI